MSNPVLNLTSEREISLVRLLARYWRLAVLIICTCIGLAGLLTLIMPRRYESRMRFLVNNERADLVITPEKNQSVAPPSEVTETQVNSEMELLKSRDILEGVIRDQKLYTAEEGKASAAPSKLQMARALQKLEKSLGINAIRKTNIVEVAFTGSDPDIAVSVLNDLGNRYLNAHLAAHSTPGTYKFFTDQVKKYSDQLTQATLALSQFHRNRKLYSMPEQQSAALAALQSADNRLNDLGAELQDQETRLAEARRQLAKAPERITTQVRATPNQLAAQQLQTSLTELRNKRIELAMKFKPGDKLLNQIDDQITNTSRDLEKVKSMNSEERTTDVDVVRQAIKSDYVRSQIAYRGLARQRSELARIRKEYLKQLSSMESDYVSLQKLEQAKKEAQDNYELYLHRLDEARLADSLDREKFSNVAMIEKPTSSPIPVSPKLAQNLAVGAMFGIFLSLAVAFFFESRGNASPELEQASQPESRYPSRAFQAASGD